VDELVPDASDPVVIAAIEANIAAFYIHLGGAPGAEVHVENDLTWFATGIPSAGFNGVMQTRLAPGASTAEVDACIGEMIATFTRRGLPMVWWVTPSTSPPGLSAYLTARGFSSIGARPYMAADLATLPQQIPQLSGVDITTVTDASTYVAWVRVFAASYGQQPDVAQRYFELISPRVGGAQTDIQHYLAWLDGTPVATATLFLHEDIAGLYHVGTLPEARGQGIGTAIVLTTLLEAWSRGLRHGVLFSSPMGLNIYRRLGFKVYCQFDRYVLCLPQSV
jgi:GNAT superfamily N-acetyltransferase